MSTFSTSVLATLLVKPIVNVLRRINRLCKERKAGQTPFQQTEDQMELIFSQTLSRLREGNREDSWWEKALNLLGRQFISPDSLKRPAVQEWLNKNETVLDLYALAKKEIVRSEEDDSEIRSRLAASYSQHTGEIDREANNRIGTIVAMLVQGYQSTISRDFRPVIGMNQAFFQNINKHLDPGKNTPPAPDPTTQQAHTEHANQTLRSILTFRLFNPPKAKQDIQELWQQVNNGNLSLTDLPTKSNISYWVARLCAGDTETVPLSREIRATLEQSDTAWNLSIIDALLANTDGETNEALRILRAQDDPDARSAFFHILTCSRSEQDALDWHDAENSCNDLLFFTAIGWKNWAICMSKNKRWEETVNQLTKIECSDHGQLALKLIEGIVNAAMLLPEDFRDIALEKVPIYENVTPNVRTGIETYHSRATACFTFVAENLINIADHELIQVITDWQLWLRLMDPNTEIARSTRHEIRQSMEDGEHAANLMMFVWAFNIVSNVEPLKRYLENRRQFGGLDDRDFLAEFLLAEMSKTPRELITYFEQNRSRLKQIISSTVVVGINICALVDDGQLKKAREALENDRDELDEQSFRRLAAIIETSEGRDIRPQLESHYRETNDLIDLQNLVQHLKAVNDHEALRPLLRELFQRHSTPENAHNYVACLTKPPSTDYEEIIRFLDANPNVLSQADDLKAVKARALFHVGQFTDSRIINDSLLHQRTQSNDLLLDVDLAIATGEWERIPEIINREWPRRDSHTPETLIALAQLAGQFDRNTERALQLSRLAAQKTPDNPHILMATYALHIQLGRDNEIDPDWLAHALEFSSPDEGPLWQINLPDLIEHIPQHREHVLAVERHWLEGKIPTSFAANLFNEPLLRLLIAIPDQNQVELDGRRRMVLPIFSGRLNSIEFQKNWVVGLDITSIVILFYLGLLERTIETFEHVKIAPETLRFLASEKNRIRFHQPSQIKAAKELQKLVRSNHVQVASNSKMPPTNVISEMGFELASLLQQAKNVNGKVVCTLPIYKAGSLKNKEADVSEYKDQIVSIIDFCIALQNAGRVGEDDYSRMMSFLRSQGQIEHTGDPSSTLNETVFIDRLALSYLQSSGVLQSASTSGLDIQIHANVLADMETLIQAEDASDLLMEKVESIRGILRGAIDSGTVAFLPHNLNQEENPEDFDIQSQATTSLLAACANYDVLCSDDRYINGRLTVKIDDAEAIPIICTLDILRHLVSCKRLSETDHWNIRHKLRQGGFVFVPFEAAELMHWTKSTTYDEMGLKETAELRIIRQTTARTNYLGLANLQETIALSANITSACITTIRSLWSEESVPIEQATAVSDWIWHYLMVATTLARQHAEQDAYWDRLRVTVGNRLTTLYTPIHASSEERQASYTNWINKSVLTSFWLANKEVIEETVETACNAVSSLAGDQANHYGHWFLKCLPETLRRIVFEKPELSKPFGIPARKTFNLEADISLTDIDLFVAAKKVLAKDQSRVTLESNGTEVSVSLDNEDGAIVLEWQSINSVNQRAKLPDFSLLSANPETRTTTFLRLIKRLGPTAPDFHHLVQKAQTQELDYDELSDIFEEIHNGVVATQRELNNKIKNNFSVKDLIPDSFSYFERFVGPAPCREAPDSYICGSLAKYREALLNKDLKTGLDICCLGALRDDLMPGQWLQSIDDDTLWDALSSCDVQNNPFSLLGALDVSLYRQDDVRFQAFSANAISQLTDDKFGQTENSNIWEVLTVLANLIHNRINVLENGPNYPSYWKRMCAWMQTGLIVRILTEHSSEYDINSLQKWANQGMTPGGLYVTLFDAREEPMLSVQQTLRNEVLNHLLKLVSRHKTEGRKIPGLRDIDKALDQCKSSGQLFTPNLPGLLEGHRRSSPPVPDTLVEELGLHRTQNLESFPWSGMVTASQSFSLGEAELECARQAVNLAIKDVTPSNFSEKLECLNLASIIALTSGDRMLADSVGNGIIRLAGDIPEIDKISQMLVTLLHAAATYSERELWLEWLEKKLADFADRLPSDPKDFLQLFLIHLSAMEIALPIRSWFHIRAKSITLAGLDVEKPAKSIAGLKKKSR